MNYEDIKKLMDDMGNSKINSLDIEFPDGIKISMKKSENNINAGENLISLSSNQAPQVNVNAQTNINNENVKEEEENYKIVKSPMVGTFYESSSPKANPFVKVGDKVKKGDVLCIIEAMKLMNEIESEFDGTIVEVLVKDGEMVEYGKPLFRIK